MKNYLFYVAVVLAFAACGKVGSKIDEPTLALNSLGAFQSTACFKNKLASQGIGQDIWTRASMDFRADGTATNAFELFTDASCVTPVLQGSNEIQYAFIKKVGSITVIQVDQLNDPNDPNSNIRYWILGLLRQDGYVMDIEYASGDSGPYTIGPGQAEADAFMANINARGVLFLRQ